MASFATLNCALAVELPASRKLVYLVLAIRANEGMGNRWCMSVAQLSRETGLNERSVQRQLKELESAGLVCREFRLGRRTSYALTVTPVADVTPEALPPAEDVAPPPSTTPPPPVADVTPPPSPVSPITEVLHKPLPKKTSAALAAGDILVLQEIPEALRAQWLAVRESKGRKVLTSVEVDDLRTEADKAGMTLVQAVTECIKRNWARFQAAWVPAQAATSPSVPSAPEAPAEPFVPPSPEFLAAMKERCQTLRSQVTLGASTGLGWAHRIIDNKRNGKPVGHAAFTNACSALGLDPRSV